MTLERKSTRFLGTQRRYGDADFKKTVFKLKPKASKEEEWAKSVLLGRENRIFSQKGEEGHQNLKEIK